MPLGLGPFGRPPCGLSAACESHRFPEGSGSDPRSSYEAGGSSPTHLRLPPVVSNRWHPLERASRCFHPSALPWKTPECFHSSFLPGPRGRFRPVRPTVPKLPFPVASSRYPSGSDLSPKRTSRPLPGHSPPTRPEGPACGKRVAPFVPGFPGTPFAVASRFPSQQRNER